VVSHTEKDMAKVEHLKVGQRVTCRGRPGVLLTVDRPTEQVVVRFDADPDPAVSADGVKAPPLPDLLVLAAEVSEELQPAAGKAPTKGEIAEARAAALKAGKAEGLSKGKLLDVQDEAEAEIVSRSAGNKPV